MDLENNRNVYKGLLCFSYMMAMHVSVEHNILACMYGIHAYIMKQTKFSEVSDFTFIF